MAGAYFRMRYDFEGAVRVHKGRRTSEVEVNEVPGVFEDVAREDEARGAAVEVAPRGRLVGEVLAFFVGVAAYGVAREYEAAVGGLYDFEVGPGGARQKEG